MPFTKSRQSAFSLVELSIVLIILGLLVGGILGGRSLIRAAELRSIPVELEQWQLAVKIFQERYDALPGDMVNATRYWGNASTGTQGGQCSTPATATGTGTQTCNGDGNGKVTYGWHHGGTHQAAYYEALRFWQHLANAELISGSYSGVSSAVYFQHAGENVPLSKTGASWGFCSLNYNSGWQWDWGQGPHHTHLSYNTLCVGMEQGNDHGGNEPAHGFLTPQEAWAIDQKSDDGNPGTGNIATARWSHCTTATHGTERQAAEYNNLHESGKRCALLFPYAF